MDGEKRIVAVDLLCVSCGYNLRTLPADARCTGCGTEISESLGKTILRWGPAYVRNMEKAASTAGALNIAALAITVLFIGAMMMLAASGNEPPTGVPILLFMSYTTIALWHAINAGRLTDSMPGQTVSLLVPVTRVSSVIFTVATLVPLSVSILATSRHEPPLGLIAFLLTAWAVLLPSLPIFIGASGRYFAGLCECGGLLSLAAWHRRTSAVLAVGVGLMWSMFALVAFKLIFQGPDPPPGRVLQFVMLLLFASGLVVAGVSFLTATGLLLMTARRLRKLAMGITEGQSLCAAAVEQNV